MLRSFDSDTPRLPSSEGKQHCDPLALAAQGSDLRGMDASMLCTLELEATAAVV